MSNTKTNEMETLTNQMNVLENEIATQQNYIMNHEDSNNVNSDKQWEEYKEDAESNLIKWDALKSMRDQLKTEAA